MAVYLYLVVLPCNFPLSPLTPREGSVLSYDVFEWGKPLQKIERDTPEPKGTEVLLRLKYCGVCHSDVHLRDGYFELGGGQRFHMVERGMMLPLTLGHEPYGTVIAAGPQAGQVPLGADRLVYPWIGCGKCERCSEGIDNYCMAPRAIGIQRPGGYADHLLVAHPRYLIDASNIEPAWAATLSCSGLATYAAISKLTPIPHNHWVAVFGAGGLGLSTIAILRAIGHERIVAIDVSAQKLTAAEEAGAAATLDGRNDDAAKKLQRIAGGAMYAAIDTVGAAETATLALEALSKGGRLIVVGLYGGAISLSLVVTILRALTIQGSHLGTVAQLKAVVALARSGKLKPIPIQKRPLSEVSRTLDELKAGNVLGRVVVETGPST
jgi:D-arabinose 1-dehydrogenase-like Zn-dependent alcohol dehydrogenase